ncbi:MAG: alpha/beta fold hydrolase [Terriglobales bacterium]
MNPIRTAKRTIQSAIAAITLSLNLPIASLAHDLQPVSMPYSSNEVTAYSMDKNEQPVMVAWKAASPTAVLIAIHGFGLHKCAFRQFAERMQQNGVSTYALDVRGFGGWMNTKKDSVVSFPDTMQDLRALVTSIRNDAPDTPIFLMGESMGGAIALSFAAANPSVIDGVISSVPSNERFRPIRTATRIAVSYLLGLGGKINMSGVLVNRVTKNKVMRKSWENDDQAKLKVTLRELIRFNHFMRESGMLARQIDTLPVLVVQGHRDNLVKPAGTEKLFNDLSTRDKQLIELENGEHLTFEEGQFDESVLAKLETWLSTHERQMVLASNG